jgi:hypothetical protein
MIFVFSIFKQNLSSQFFDLDIENPLGGGHREYSNQARPTSTYRNSMVSNSLVLRFGRCHESAKWKLDFNGRCLFGRLARAMTANVISISGRFEYNRQDLI